MTTDENDNNEKETCRKILVLHGSRQTGELLLGRMAKLRKKLKKQMNIDLCTMDAPFQYPIKDSEDERLELTWWKYSVDNLSDDYRCHGLAQSLIAVLEQFKEIKCEGIIGFSQGARLAHYIAVLHQFSKGVLFSSLKYVIICAGYQDPIPIVDFNEFLSLTDISLEKHDLTNFGQDLLLPSLHIYGSSDRLIEPSRSQALADAYRNSKIFSEHEHSGGHHVPMRAADVQTILDFVARTNRQHQVESVLANLKPDEEHELMQLEEISALEAIYEDDFKLISDAGRHPIEFEVKLVPTEGDERLWPCRPLKIRVKYSPSYPDSLLECGQNVGMVLTHDMNVFEFPSIVEKRCLEAAANASVEAGEGIPHVFLCINAIRGFFEDGGLALESNEYLDADACKSKSNDNSSNHMISLENASCYLSSVSANELETADKEGKDIASILCGYDLEKIHGDENLDQDKDESTISAKGGGWKYVIGLVGKPSAGKSTFFNAATCFAKQRDQQEGFGASMAPHPFTTIDPNVGFCFVPAPYGLCPEDDCEERVRKKYNLGSSHGRDSRGRRLLPVMLKDVAGLVPGAYEGRGKGNKFLDDLTDADVLVHVVDASGKSDNEGNIVDSTHLSDPMNDLAWIRNELLQWIESNLTARWDTIARKGRRKLADMFSGYKQQQRIIWDVLLGVEKYMYEEKQQDKALDHLSEWNTGDLRRLVSAFLGVRFPMSLALNKFDKSTASVFIKNIMDNLPIHGAHAGVGLSAKQEMEYVQKFMVTDIVSAECNCNSPIGVWDTLHSAISLRKPVIVFPVVDFLTYEPLSGMLDQVTRDASLPSPYFVECLHETPGASPPSMWDIKEKQYTHKKNISFALRDAIIMKPGSTVEDLFLYLKNKKVLSGEFVRAEAAAFMGDGENCRPKPISKQSLLGKHNRIVKIMTNKRKAWQ